MVRNISIGTNPLKTKEEIREDMKIYVCFKTHCWDDWRLPRFLRLVHSLRISGNYTSVLLFNGDENDIPQRVKNTVDDYICYTVNDLLPLCKDNNYPSKSIDFNSRTEYDDWSDAAASYLPILLYHKKLNNTNNKEQRVYYWHVEDDVYYRGEWAELFNNFLFSSADLITTHVTNEVRRMSWVRDTLSGYGLENMKRYTSLMGLSRISDRLCNELLKAYAEGAEGHFECLVPTLCVNKFGENSIEDVGERFYTKAKKRKTNVGTFGWMKIRREKEKDFEFGKVYHAVKWTCKDEQGY